MAGPSQGASLVAAAGGSGQHDVLSPLATDQGLGALVCRKHTFLGGAPLFGMSSLLSSRAEQLLPKGTKVNNQGGLMRSQGSTNLLSLAGTPLRPVASSASKYAREASKLAHADSGSLDHCSMRAVFHVAGGTGAFWSKPSRSFNPPGLRQCCAKAACLRGPGKGCCEKRTGCHGGSACASQGSR